MIHAGGGAKAGGGRKQKVCGEQRGFVVRDEHGSFQSAFKTMSDEPVTSPTNSQHHHL